MEKVFVFSNRFDKINDSIILIDILTITIYWCWIDIKDYIPPTDVKETLPKRKIKRLERKGLTRRNLLCSDWYWTIEAGTGQTVSAVSVFIVSFGHRIFFN